MRKFLKPALAVVAGIAVSWGLQGVGVEPLWAKLAGLAVTLGMIGYWWRRSAAL